MEAVTVRVPASTSNLGPGFDCLGVALRIYNEVTVRHAKRRHASAMIERAADAFFARAEIASIPFSVAIRGDVPMSRGLGSSVTVRLGVMHGLNHLLGRPLDRETVFQLCAELEGHPDNAAPAEFGGFNVIRGLQRQRFTVAAKLKFVLLVPNFEVSTEKARALLPNEIDRRSAVESCGNACAITAAFASGEYKNLRGALADGLHQPFRKPLVPLFDEVVRRAEEAGALGAFLSGSGSTVAALTLRSAEKIARAMREAAPNARTTITTADNRGAHMR
ncbi:MAG: homoserine kinase [Chthoniobacterales bacterium]